MKTRIACIFMSLMLLAGLVAVAQEQDVAGVVAAGEEFIILETALEQAGLLETLRGEGPFTVFAPTDAAFEAFFAQRGVTAEELLSHPGLESLLLYHVLAGKVLSTDLQNGMTAETLSGRKVMVDMTGGAVRINTSGVTGADVEASNGVVHVVDRVLVPPTFRFAPRAEVPAPVAEPAAEAAPALTVADTLLANPEFSILAAALERAGLTEALRGEGPFTVFAPTNAAFEQLLAKNGLTADDL
ncbi:MAG TPA: fasciclin domain-containing protein, partial [Candidatus Limnocylindria bacterium]|nr:fasciclin domain-containing protein [Candidatus Limnocylindria bacterium]